MKEIKVEKVEHIDTMFTDARIIYALAQRYGKDAIEQERAAWGLLNEMYPETKTGTWKYDQEKHVLTQISPSKRKEEKDDKMG